jgi:hypothetical protein
MTLVVDNLAPGPLLAMHPAITAMLLTLTLVAAVLVTLFVATQLRARARAKHPEAKPAFSLEQLEAMRDRGQLNDEEFRHLRNLAMAKTLSDMDIADRLTAPASRDEMAPEADDETPEEKPQPEDN